MTALSQFFQEPRYERALDSYAKFAGSQGWDIGHKLAMYNRAKAAFDSDLDEQKRRKAFHGIYDDLKRYWQVFRNASLFWTADETFDVLTNDCRAISRQSGLTLTTLRPDTRESGTVFEGLSKLRDLKGTKYYPWMPVAKFTHFFNPLLFPPPRQNSWVDCGHEPC